MDKTNTSGEWLKCQKHYPRRKFCPFAHHLLVYVLVTTVKLDLTKQFKGEDLLWLMISEGSTHGYLAPRTWAEHHGGRSVWRRGSSSPGGQDRPEKGLGQDTATKDMPS
jgi:hypothetical protein